MKDRIVNAFFFMLIILMIGFYAGKVAAPNPYQDGYDRGYCSGKGVECLPPILAPESLPTPQDDVTDQGQYDRGFRNGFTDRSDQKSGEQEPDQKEQKKREW